MPEILNLEAVPLSQLWPKKFKIVPPDGGDIGLLFVSCHQRKKWQIIFLGYFWEVSQEESTQTEQTYKEVFTDSACQPAGRSSASSDLMLNIPPGFSIDVPPGFTKAHCKLQIEAAAVSYADAPSSLILDAPPGFFTDIPPGFTEAHRRLPGASSMGKAGKADEMKIMHNEVKVEQDENSEEREIPKIKWLSDLYPSSSDSTEASTRMATDELAAAPAGGDPSAALSLSIWPPTQRTRDDMVRRLVETLTTDTILCKRRGVVPGAYANPAARAIEAEAFDAAAAIGGAAASVEEGIKALQFYSKEVSRRLRDFVKSRSASAKAEAPPEEEALAAVEGETA
ncbi:uncharacterized protein LOC120689720 isoform X2 [Panicum virgatum]|uniref:uncharacterized protein LOC120689720 isoform X2 n=1 Tax=Panicum virgatum TaxID=38727 RepID=UPI0019D60484|nr:uncharacterized protein LOC120689720 isoform X2 [Panicum virgatum]